MISVLEAKRLLHKGYESYLAHMVDKSTPKVALDSVFVVQEFLNIFSKDLSGLPPDRELEFGIELLSGLALVSIPPCRMALAEMKKLKTQLQDLVGKDFI